VAFYKDMHQTFSDQGFTFLKVDNQLVTEKMALGTYPIFDMSEKMHEALYQSADQYFDGAVVNCMNMTAEAYLNFGNSAVARAVEDYFPAEPERNSGVGYKMPYGNAAVHLTMAFYNSLYMQQMVYPDFDMFESSNPDAEFHAVARAINNGPIYLTDKPGEQNFDLLKKLCYSDGGLIRPATALTPTADCLFQLQEAKPMKAFSMDGQVGLLGVWNMADIEKVSGTVSASDIADIAGEDFMVYEYFSKRHWKISKSEQIDVELPRMGTKLFFFIPVTHDAAPFGLIDKYNAPGTIVEQSVTGNSMTVEVADHGVFSAVVPKSPVSASVDGASTTYNYEDGLITVKSPAIEVRKNHKVSVTW
ncbi:MAG: Sip1-related alpha-galactosidase, partial [Bacteroidota bacterium]